MEKTKRYEAIHRIMVSKGITLMIVLLNDDEGNSTGKYTYMPLFEDMNILRNIKENEEMRNFNKRYMNWDGSPKIFNVDVWAELLLKKKI